MVKPVSMADMVARLQSVQSEMGMRMPEIGRTGAGADFGKLLETSLGAVNQLQHEASSMAAAFERGEPGVDIASTMIASQKASLAFQATTQVRNHLVRAYQDVMNMPI